MGFKIIIEGDFACFIRPEIKASMVSYDVPTLGALEAIIKSVFWKPAIRYVIDKIVVFNPISFIHTKLKAGANADSIYKLQETSQALAGRESIVLKNPKYGIEFHFELTGIKSQNESEKKYYNIIKRRLEKGQNFRQAYLGCREFPLRKIEIVENFDLSAVDKSLMGERDLGYMLHSMVFKDGGIPENNDWENPTFSSEALPRFYRPLLVDGVIDMKKHNYSLVY